MTAPRPQNRRKGPRRKPLDPARGAAFEVLRAVSEREAYANLALPAAAAPTRYQRPRRRIRHRADLRHLPHHAACSTRSSARPPDVHRKRSIRCCSICCGSAPTSCCAPGSARTRRCPPPSNRPASNSIRRERVSSTVCCAPSPGATSSPGSTSWLPIASADPIGHAAFVHAHPRWIAQAFADALGAAAGELDAALASDDERPQVHLVARPDQLTAAELADTVHGTVGRYSPYAVYLPGGDPGQLAAGARRTGSGSGRGQPVGGPGADAGAGRRRRPDAGWTCAPGPAARPRCWPRSACRPGPGSRRSSRRRVARTWWSRTPPGCRWRCCGSTARQPVSSRALTGCSSMCPAPGWAHCAAGPRRAGGVSRPTCRSWPGCSVSCWPPRSR